MDYKKLNQERKELLNEISKEEIKEWLEFDNNRFNSELEKCCTCDNILDEFAEYGTCFDCIMNSSVAGQFRNN